LKSPAQGSDEAPDWMTPSAWKIQEAEGGEDSFENERRKEENVMVEVKRYRWGVCVDKGEDTISRGCSKLEKPHKTKKAPATRIS